MRDVVLCEFKLLFGLLIVTAWGKGSMPIEEVHR